jgi:hypothetical protein
MIKIGSKLKVLVDHPRDAGVKSGEVVTVCRFGDIKGDDDMYNFYYLSAQDDPQDTSGWGAHNQDIGTMFEIIPEVDSVFYDELRKLVENVKKSVKEVEDFLDKSLDENVSG